MIESSDLPRFKVLTRVALALMISRKLLCASMPQEPHPCFLPRDETLRRCRHVLGASFVTVGRLQPRHQGSQGAALSFGPGGKSARTLRSSLAEAVCVPGTCSLKPPFPSGCSAKRRFHRKGESIALWLQHC